VNLRGKTRGEIEQRLATKSRSELLDLVHSLVTVEQLFKPSEVAARTHVNKRAILRDVRDGKFGDYIVRAENSVLLPASGIKQWLDRYRVSVNGKDST
jgi:hypothetical protein